MSDDEWITKFAGLTDAPQQLVMNACERRPQS